VDLLLRLLDFHRFPSGLVRREPAMIRALI
jgi:hypothetical protein